MKYRKRKITIFCSLILLLLQDGGLAGRGLLVFLLLTSFGWACSYVAAETGMPKRYKGCFGLSAFFAVSLYFSHSLFWMDCCAFLSIIFGLLALYRTIYPCGLSLRSLYGILQDVVFLLFANIDAYLVSENRTAVEKKKETRRWIAAVFALIFLVLFAFLFSFADYDFAAAAAALLYAAQEYLPVVILSLFAGMVLAVFINSFIVGLLNGDLEKNPNWYFKKRAVSPAMAIIDDIRSFFYSEELISILLYVAGFFNVCFILVEIYHYSLLIADGEIAESMGKGYVVILVCIFIEGSFFYISGRYKKDHGDNVCRFDRLWVIVGILSMIVLILAGMRYFYSIMEAGIHKENSWLLYFYVGCFIYICCFLKSALSGKGEFWNFAVWERMVLVFVIIFFLWNENWFPKYNSMIFLYKYKKEEWGTEMPIQRGKLNVEEMMGIGKAAVPALVKLADLENPYADTGESVGETALKGIVMIYKEDFAEKEWQQIKEMTRYDQLRKIVSGLKEKPYYSFGIRGESLQVLEEYLDAHEDIAMEVKALP